MTPHQQQHRFFAESEDSSSRLHSTDIAFKPAESGWGGGSKYTNNFDAIFGGGGGSSVPSSQNNNIIKEDTAVINSSDGEDGEGSKGGES
eukprot:CAMPEP_0181102074 /NCGR_PEP_ID=MMETSP1071-20121207/14113_1 /TAXON_ID=35127 /ORGANISM="Thalassiosira sp., Strain NH16" /LENGTH=89 /DNA_ID=CAMNT_0023185007 /DNA_START=237 /DNA_END=506 /DNA_ORIENTATION=-